MDLMQRCKLRFTSKNLQGAAVPQQGGAHRGDSAEMRDDEMSVRRRQALQGRQTCEPKDGGVDRYRVRYGRRKALQPVLEVWL